MLNAKILLNTLKRYINSTTGIHTDFIIKKNPLSLWGLFIKLPEVPIRRNVLKDELSKYTKFGLYPPIMVLIKSGDSRPLRILQSHYKGINSIKGRLQALCFRLLKYPLMQNIILPVSVIVFTKKFEHKAMYNVLGSMVFGGLGSKIKIFNFEDCTITNILKDGYDQTAYFNEVTIREKFYDVLPLTKLIKNDTNSLYYQEEYLNALPLRYIDQSTKPALLSIFTDLLGFYELNKIDQVLTDVYQDHIVESIRQNTIYVSKHVKKLSLIAANEIVNLRYKPNEEYTKLVKSHGDLWLGNILKEIGKKRLVIVDWERTHTNSLMHDYFNLVTIFAIEQRNLNIINKFISLTPRDNVLLEVINEFKKRFAVDINSIYIESQFRNFLLERLCCLFRLIKTSPSHVNNIEVQIEEWSCLILKIVEEQTICRAK